MIKNRTAALTAVCITLGLTSVSSGQIDLKCRLTKSRVLPFEEAMVTVSIMNRTGRDIVLSGENANARFSFEVEDGPGSLLPVLENEVLLEPLTLAPGQERRTSVNLALSHDIRKTGPYTVTGRLDWGGLAFRSPRMYLDVVPGLEIDKVVAPAGDSGEMRIFRLLTLNRERMDRLFIRVDDARIGLCYGVVELGRMLRSFKPVLQADARGRIHVLHQSGPSRFMYDVLTSEGVPVTHESFSSTNQRVGLATQQDGSISVSRAED